jgi:tetratricopeptide (TPR) repeat protein
VSFITAQNQQIQSKINLAEMFIKSGELERAKSLYYDLVNQQPWNFELFSSLNNVLLRLKQYEESINLITGKIKSSPNDPGYYGLLGTTYHTKGEYEKAYEAWDKAIEISPNSESNIRLIVNFAVQNRAFDKAVEYLREGKEISKNPTSFSFQLGNYLLSTMKFKEGADEFCEIVKQNPKQLNSVKGRFQRYLNREQAYNAFIESVENYYDETNMPQYLELLGFIYSFSKKYDKAFKTLVKYEEETKSNGIKIYNFANNSFLEKNYEISQSAYKYLIDNYENSSFIPKCRIGYIRSKHFKLEGELKNHKQWKPLLSVDTTGAYQFDEVLDTYNELINKYNRASYKIEILYEIGKIYEEIYYDFQKADSVYKSIIHLNKNSRITNESLARLVSLSIKNNNIKDAEKYTAQILTGKKSNQDQRSFAKFINAKISFWKGDVDSSLNQLQQITNNLTDNYSNNAIELSIIQNSLKKDSVSLTKFAKADMLIKQQKYVDAKNILNELAGNKNLFLITDAVKYKLAEINITLDSLEIAERLLTEISDSEMTSAYSDKSLFLLGNLYLKRLNNNSKARLVYQKLLENFPNSLYFDKSRQILNSLGERNI